MSLAERGRPRRPAAAAPAGTTWLDHLSAQGRVADARVARAESTAALWGGRVLMFVTFFILFVGFSPLQHGAVESSGSAVRQASFLLLAALGVPFILSRWRLALAVLARSWPLLLVFAALAATTLWSQFPSVTVKRLVVLVVIVVVGLGLAVALPRPRAYMVPFAAAFGAVLAIDLLLAVALPGLAYDNLGLAALHPSKNVAGMVGQAMAITFAACMVGTRNPLAFWGLAVLTLLSFVFLAMTQSKTALGLTVICTFGLLPALAIAGRSTAMAFLIGSGVLLVAGGITFATGALELSAVDWAVITTGDPTFTNRDDIWAASYGQITKRPWFGYGFGAVWSMMPYFSPLKPYLGFWTDNPDIFVIINQSHNGYLDIMEHGGFFLASFVALFVVMTFVAIGRSLGRPGADRWTVAGSAFFGTFFVSFLFSNMLESTMFFPDGLLGQVMILCVLAFAAWRVTGEADAAAAAAARRRH